MTKSEKKRKSPPVVYRDVCYVCFEEVDITPEMDELMKNPGAVAYCGCCEEGDHE